MNYAFAAFYANGNMAMWSVRAGRKECAQAAVRGMMGATEYANLDNDVARWKDCYKRGCRIRPVVVTEVTK